MDVKKAQEEEIKEYSTKLNEANGILTTLTKEYGLCQEKLKQVEQVCSYELYVWSLLFMILVV